LFLEYEYEYSYSTSTLTIMPPNCKGSTDLADDITNLNVANFVTTAKYQPLTQPQMNAHTVQEIQGKTDDSVPVVSYWDWPTNANSPKKLVVERILKEERTRQLFSANRIGSNLIAAAEKAASMEEDTVAVTDKETDDYWFTPEGEHAEEDITSQCVDTASEPATGAAAAEPRQNYWDFPAFKAQERVARAVMEKERIRQMFTVDHMQERLMEQCSQTTEPAPLEATTDAYWVFKTVASTLPLIVHIKYHAIILLP
jgi:hypothetical protein